MKWIQLPNNPSNEQLKWEFIAAARNILSYVKSIAQTDF